MSPFLISDDHAARYADKMPPWGFNGLGYITYKRTYARPIFAEGSDVIERTEEWYETVQRVVNGAQNIGAELSEDEAKRLYDYLFNLKGSVAGRMLWQLGTANNERLGGDSLVNCLGGETEVVTRHGIKRIDDLAAIGHATVMTDFGKWVTADVLNFGDQPLAEIVLHRGRQVKTVRATAEHRWFVVGVDGREEYFTRELANGMRLVSVHPEETEDEESFVHWEVVSVGNYGEPEPVYCAVVPETHSFVLANNILTGNCWFVDIEKPTDFSWAVERLMLGGGVGFSCDKPERLGVVRAATVTHRDADDSDFIVPDTREGWGNLIRKVFECYLGDDDYPSVMTYATHLVRPAGVPIKTFGGSASGPEILISGVEKICSVLDGAAGRNMTSVEVLDCMNIIGSIVVAGNVRRSAEIAVGSLDDEDYLMAKRWDLGDIPIERAMSNNTVFVSTEQMKDMPDLIWEGYKGNGEPYGFFNLETSRKFGRTGEERPDNSIVGVNPCAEIPLANRESCNLSEIFLPMIDSPEELKDVAVLLYKVQKAVAALSYLDPTSDAITSKNMRLGLGVTGVAQAMDKVDWLDDTYVELRKFDSEWSAKRGWPESVRITTIKPSGTLSLLPGVTPGVHPGFSQYFVKRMRMSASDILVNYCRSKGFHVEPLRNFDGSEDARTVVVEFPCAFPDGTILAEHMSAIEQMDLVRRLQRVWADNSISVTVYYRKHELEDIKAYLAEHWGEMKSVSFLLHSEHGFDQAPMGEMGPDEYAEMMRNSSPLGEKLSGSTILSEDEMALYGESCDTNACPMR